MTNQFWHRRYHSDALHGFMALTLEERGAYQTLLDLMYDRGDAIVDNERLLAGYMGVSIRKWKSIRDSLIEKGKICITEDGRLFNERAAKELENDAKIARKRAENGLKGGRKKAENAKKDNKNNESHLATLEQSPSIIKVKVRDIDLSNDKSLSETEIENDDFDNPPPAKPSTDEVDQAVEIWNKASGHYGWPAIRKLNPDRRKKLAARLSEIGGVAEWRAALVRATKGMLGAQPPPTWFSFDWITTNQTNILKVIEGNYDRKFGENGNGTGTNHGGAVGNRGVSLGVMVDLARKFRDEENSQTGSGSGLQLLAGPDAGDGFLAGTG